MFDIQTKVLEGEAFRYFLDLEIKKAMRYQYFFSLLVIEPDLIEDIPHEIDIIETIAGLIRDELRITDIIGRIGRNNFYVILPHAESNNTYSVAERIRCRVESYTFSKKDGLAKGTVSVGGACFPTHANEFKHLMSNATEMIGKAKNIGGNRVCLPN